MLPASGTFWPLSMSKQVLFPAPFGPISARIFAGLERERHAAHGMDAAIGFAQAFDPQQCRCGGAHSAVSIRDASSADFDELARRRCRKLSHMPTMPLGNATTISTMIAPSTSFERSVWLTSQIESAL